MNLRHTKNGATLCISRNAADVLTFSSFNHWLCTWRYYYSFRCELYISLDCNKM